MEHFKSVLSVGWKRAFVMSALVFFHVALSCLAEVVKPPQPRTWEAMVTLVAHHWGWGVIYLLAFLAGRDSKTRYKPEGVIEGSPLVTAVDPGCQVEFHDGNKFRGHGVRVGDWIVLPFHVVRGSREWILRKGSQEEVVDQPDFEVLQDDLIALRWRPRFTSLGLRKAKVSLSSYVEISSRGVGSSGSVKRSNREGYLLYSGSTKPGYSGAALMSGKHLRAIHLGGMTKSHNFCVDASFVEALLDAEVFMDDSENDELDYEAEETGDVVDVTEDVRMGRSARFAGGKLQRDSQGRYKFTGLEELRSRVDDLEDRRQQEYEDYLERELERVENNLQAKGWEFDAKARRRVTNLVRKKFAYDEEAAGQEAAVAAGVAEDRCPPNCDGCDVCDPGYYWRSRQKAETALVRDRGWDNHPCRTNIVVDVPQEPVRREYGERQTQTNECTDVRHSLPCKTCYDRRNPSIFSRAKQVFYRPEADYQDSPAEAGNVLSPSRASGSQQKSSSNADVMALRTQVEQLTSILSSFVKTPAATSSTSSRKRKSRKPKNSGSQTQATQQN